MADSVWNKEADDALMEGVAAGLSFAKVGRLLGRSDSACHHRFKAIVKGLDGEQWT